MNKSPEFLFASKIQRYRDAWPRRFADKVTPAPEWYIKDIRDLVLEIQQHCENSAPQKAIMFLKQVLKNESTISLENDGCSFPDLEIFTDVWNDEFIDKIAEYLHGLIPYFKSPKDKPVRCSRKILPKDPPAGIKPRWFDSIQQMRIAMIREKDLTDKTAIKATAFKEYLAKKGRAGRATNPENGKKGIWVHPTAINHPTGWKTSRI